MYNVMLVDDDYPVIELLSETICWEELGFRLMGAHENGQIAWEHAQREMPDILITDIGMPQMNGLELSARIKELKPEVRIAILSCHNEFQYAQAAMRLHVQDYLLKDALDPEDLVQLLRRFKLSMDEENKAGWENSRLKHLFSGTRELRIEQSIKNFIQQPLLSPEKWRAEAAEFGLFAHGESCFPVIAYLEDYRHVKYRFTSEQTLHFALSNVMNEVLEGMKPSGLYVGYNVKSSFLLFSYKPGLQGNIHAEAAALLKTIQSTVFRVLKIHLSFITGEGCETPEGLKQRLNQLLTGEEQRFYLEHGAIAKCKPPAPEGIRQNLFSYYDQASIELREVLLGRQPELAGAVSAKWISLIREQQYLSETVKDWMLKLLLDLKLKLHSLQSARPAYSADTLHKEIVDIDSLPALQEWMNNHLESIVAAKGAGAGACKRVEVTEACQYVSLRLGSRITLDEVADHLHLNASYFSRLFKKEMGVTFIEYITRLKMERAKELLDATHSTVGEICEQLGYDNQSYFIKTFKLHTGATPVEYRG
ncbi:response regulator transcription factor [Paenibacillus donghaensis]|uniref:DNA-binding response regulator n=1 Tax=Paenibacillus donghaensis TaxID=414771 RepID=A0A2Z2K8Q1_9BACL|nr:helix-turn-helix domain-containing protein [Paenibacillus donghaensis]ASA23006.1 DNA-binding response regulator [Paenibacillus donghaensis]